MFHPAYRATFSISYKETVETLTICGNQVMKIEWSMIFLYFVK